ncbi:class I SAM-dependent methyltransferase [Loktanella agnita]|uniref:class I SAM-dependent methyltransferase n=1 Tax=Loktanella agnita TaxID=287097 RepID=UPI00398573CA
MMCPVCGSADVASFFTLPAVPVICNQLWPDAAAGRAAPAGDVDLTLCNNCAMIWNAGFAPEKMVYAPGYENALHFSPNFRTFAEGLAKSLVDEFDLAGKDVVEIGCGDGYMLDLLAANGVAHATGFDPSMRDVQTPYTRRDGVRIEPEYFRSDQLDRPFDAVLCRHVLEHLDDPMLLLRDIRKAIGDRDIPVYFEVPNASWMLDSVSLWDVIYEHVGYWTEASISVAFVRAGFDRVAVNVGYGDQFLMVRAWPGEAQPNSVHPAVEATRDAAQRFADLSNAELEKWHDRLVELDGQAVIWGAGSKGITFANAVGAPPDSLAGLVDLNTRKHGLYAPGAALPVMAPEALSHVQPALILIANTLYETEITRQVRDMGLSPDFGVIAG